jgi:hypothetical protein
MSGWGLAKRVIKTQMKSQINEIFTWATISF